MAFKVEGLGFSYNPSPPLLFAEFDMLPATSCVFGLLDVVHSKS